MQEIVHGAAQPSTGHSTCKILVSCFLLLRTWKKAAMLFSTVKLVQLALVANLQDDLMDIHIIHDKSVWLIPNYVKFCSSLVFFIKWWIYWLQKSQQCLGYSTIIFVSYGIIKNVNIQWEVMSFVTLWCIHVWTKSDSPQLVAILKLEFHGLQFMQWSINRSKHLSNLSSLLPSINDWSWRVLILKFGKIQQSKPKPLQYNTNNIILHPLSL